MLKIGYQWYVKCGYGVYVPEEYTYSTLDEIKIAIFHLRITAVPADPKQFGKAVEDIPSVMIAKQLLKEATPSIVYPAAVTRMTRDTKWGA